MALLIKVMLVIAAAFYSTNADVKHVLEGSAQPPQHIHTYNCEHPQGYPFVPPYPGGAPQDSNNAVPGSVAFWWADTNSPFKHAYEYFKKCSEKGNCVPPVAPGFQLPNTGCAPNGCNEAQSGFIQIKDESSGNEQKWIDISKNPFLNGKIPVLPAPIAGGDQIDISKNPFLNGNIGGSSSSPGDHGCGGSGCTPASVASPTYNSNPFLNGGGCGGAGCNSIAPIPSEKPLDLSKNPFLNGGVGNPAFSGNGRPIETGSNGFLGVQPAIPFGANGIKTKPFTTNYPKEVNQGGLPVPDDNQVKPDGKPFSINYPGSTEDSCNGLDQVCVAPELCINGFVNTDGAGILDRRHSSTNCETDKVCCSVRPETTHSTSGGVSSDGSSAFTSSEHTSFPSRSFEGTFTNTLDIKNGKTAPPGSIIKFNGGAGISPGSIQVVSDNEAEPKPLVSSSGESGSGIAHSATSDVPVFASTPDYSNDDLSHISFVSTTQGPQYLPPDASPKPNIEIPDLIAPSILTYQPSIPTTPRPITKPVLPGASIVSVHTQPSPIPFVPSLPQPFIPRQPIAVYTPKPTPFEFIPLLPSSPKPFVPRPAVSISTYPPIVHEPIIPQLPYHPPFIQPEPEITHIYRPSTPTVIFENRIKPSEPSNIPYFPKVTSQPTPGYKYPTPTPAFEYPSPVPSPSTPKPSFSINDNFISIRPKPTPKPYRPQTSDGYEYKKPTPSFPTPTPKPYNPQPQPSDGYEYKRPTPSFPTPYPSTNEYLPPHETPKPYNPQPQPSDGYEYKRPPGFPTPSPSTIVTSNQYLPPFEPSQPNRIPDGSNTNEFFISKPPVGPSSTYIPPIEGQPDVQVPSIIKFPRPQQPSPPHAGCAAALKCVQEIYCTAEGVISPVPVILSKEQQLARVPTTECTDREAGIVGKCCRDPNYVDPWPSANSINGFDDGKYREDPRLGQYVPQQQRLQRSETRINAVKAPIRTRSHPSQNIEANKNNTCGVRHINSQPRGLGRIDATFAEIPWQAMVLRDSTRTLLCGGVIVKPNAVLTSSSCVQGLATSDILIKGGEWKLGIDEEPLPFQIVKVAAIVRHHLYTPGSLQNDLALLMLEENLQIAKNIAPICLSKNNQIQKQKCIATGWGKRILQVHLRGAIMKSIDINILNNKQCEQVIKEKYQESLPKYSTNTICGFSKDDQCDVDYGSALACTNGNGQYTLSGIFSWDTGCKDDAQIGGYIPPDVEWIEDTCSKPINQLKALDRQYRSQ